MHFITLLYELYSVSHSYAFNWLQITEFLDITQLAFSVGNLTF